MIAEETVPAHLRARVLLAHGLGEAFVRQGKRLVHEGAVVKPRGEALLCAAASASHIGVRIASKPV